MHSWQLILTLITNYLVSRFIRDKKQFVLELLIIYHTWLFSVKLIDFIYDTNLSKTLEMLFEIIP